MIACILLGFEDAVEGIEARLDIPSAEKHADMILWFIREKLVDPTTLNPKEEGAVELVTALRRKTCKRDPIFGFLTEKELDVDWNFLQRACVRGNKGSKALSERIVKWAFEDDDMVAEFGAMENSSKLAKRLRNMVA